MDNLHLYQSRYPRKGRAVFIIFGTSYSHRPTVCPHKTHQSLLPRLKHPLGKEKSRSGLGPYDPLELQQPQSEHLANLPQVILALNHLLQPVREYFPPLCLWQVSRLYTPLEQGRPKTAHSHAMLLPLQCVEPPPRLVCPLAPRPPNLHCCLPLQVIILRKSSVFSNMATTIRTNQ